jgi:hypothetical protein
MFIFIACIPFVYSDTVRAIASIADRPSRPRRPWAPHLGRSSRRCWWRWRCRTSTNLRHLFGMAFGTSCSPELINATYGLGYLLMTSQRRGLSEHIILVC